MSNPIYVTAAFRSGHKNQAYIFMKKEYLIEEVNPGTCDDKILYGPAKVNEYSASLKGTVFGDKGIDCAFPSQEKGVAFIFSGHLCAKWSYGLETAENKLLVGPSPIEEVFPYLKGTVFVNGLDAAFETSRPYEVYLFKGDKYVRINYEGAGKVLNTSRL
ncbi:albumin-2-like [Amaranthus tricolor]|uniref:albumin-2-like n=1 Tax=Amaranthus tricolor TaxID=29722 RepID=UPI00258ADADC|nr:albumin-2-like [Amaranthus tricolor]XP_057541979.1 albumin-2-like [Amaranthus tricolor]XP_057541980.1 albumin-2-like [Amaranthus tricolor]XP_057541981.1 albumin-2-like [Amaranthus tricolor]XP_057541982.1 albumin-2-like [Amaranthus tricolor]XP_057541983.1 albumin-2-like [Amaranthus tricolor]XP_057541984.1 albumin-2-like [Amaranthus tricolor]